MGDANPFLLPSGQGYSPPPRFGELSKLLPVAVVMGTILFMYVEYVFLHCLRLLQFTAPSYLRDLASIQRGAIQLGLFHLITGLLLYCLGRCFLTHPGSIPDGKGWELRQEGDQNLDASRSALVEKKGSGERRHCKWCLKYKPDRTHHCRVCNMCVLRMDHHCPWVYNCIGFRNHKYFFLLLFYAALDLLFISLTMFESVWWSTRIDVSVSMMIALAAGETFSTFLAVTVSAFFGFHVWLMSKSMTTVEYCEKSLKKVSYNSSIYSQGLYKDICAVLGPQPLLWLLPISLPDGDGMTFGATSETPE